MGVSDATNAELRTRIHQQEVVAELGTQALESGDIDRLMHDATVAVAETLDNDYCKVLELLPDGEEVFLRQGVGWRDGLVGSATVPTDLDSQAGYTLISEEPVIVDDLASEERFSGPDLLTDHGVVSGISVIIGSVEAPWGILGTHTTDRREFTDDDATFVQSVANVLAAAIENEETSRTLQREITKRKDRERELERYEQIVETVNDGIYVVDGNGRFTMVNDAYSELTGYARDELLGSHVSLVVDGEIVEAAKDLEAEMVAGTVDTPVKEAEILTADGDLVPAEATFSMLPGDERERIGVARDISERKARERELGRTLDLLEKTEHIADVGGWEIDPETMEVFWTDHIFELLEFPIDEEPPLDGALDVYHEDDRPKVEQAIENALESGDPFDVEARFSTSSGQVGWFRIQGVPETADGEVVSLRGAVQDITEHKQRERKLRESNQRLEQFAYAASHDLQEPLRMVSSYLQLLERRYEDALDEEGEEFLSYAVDGADRMRQMIDGLLAYSRVDTQGDPFEPVELDAVLEAVRTDLDVQIDERDAEITVASLPRVEGDASQLRQLFQNLLDNALTYAGDDPPRITVSADRDGQRWVISVSDEGIGIDPDDTDTIFDVFQRLHSHGEYEGTGIGLALCQRIVERHGGDIWVESERGAGSTFSVSLPAATDRVE